MKKKYWLLASLLTTLSALGLGIKWRPTYPAFSPKIADLELDTDDLEALERHITDREAATPRLKINNEARIVWAKKPFEKTAYSIVFLHGFSASPMEGSPLVQNLSQKYGCNAYLARLAQHGIDDPDSFRDLSPKDLIDSAKEAIAIGQSLGGKVIVMGSSTGCTLAAYLAAHNPERIHSLLFYSPNIDLASPSSHFLTYPLGLYLARLMLKSKYRSPHLVTENEYLFWTNRYRLEGLVALKQLIKDTMKKTVFEKITQPLFIAYYYKSDKESDKVISIKALKDFYEQVATPTHQKRLTAFANAGCHVITSDINCQEFEKVQADTFDFLEKVIKF